MSESGQGAGLDLFSLRGRVALVTGAARGIGRSTALTMARHGARVVVSDRDVHGALAVAGEIVAMDGAALGIECDVADDDALRRLVKGAIDRFGRIDILVCNAGIAPHLGPLAEARDDEYRSTLDVNLRSAWKLTSLVTPAMVERRDGVVVLISSIAGVRGNKALGLYSLSKAAVAALARNIAVELGPYNVRANALSPGVVTTEFAKGLTDNAEFVARRVAQTPLRRFGTPDEIAAAAVFLASPGGAFITGQNLVIDGGTTIGDGS